jgi:hypothetical protein
MHRVHLLEDTEFDLSYGPTIDLIKNAHSMSLRSVFTFYDEIMSCTPTLLAPTQEWTMV